MAEVVVIGAGVGGMAAAIRLAGRGHAVTVIERNASPGGKLASVCRDGFAFDTGPCLLTLPAVFDELLALAGTSLATACGAVRLDRVCSYRFADGSGFSTRAGLGATVGEVETFSPGSGGEWRRFHDHGHRVWDVAARTFFAGPMEGVGDLLARVRSPADLLAVDGARTLHSRAVAGFSDPRLRMWAGRYATYAGSSPYRAPAALSCIPYVEQAFGCWYLRGGVVMLGTALVRAAERLGVRMRTGVEVRRIVTTAGEGRRKATVTGVVLAGGEVVGAEVVVSDADALHVYADLLPHARRLGRLRRRGPSSSAVVLLAAVDGSTPGLAHHNVSFSPDYRREFDQIFGRRAPPDDPTVYVCMSSGTDPAQAPPGCENWSILVNVPAGRHLDWEVIGPAYRDRVLAVMADRGWDLAGRLRWCELITPAVIEEATRCVGGAIYGPSSNSRHSAFLRAANRGPVAGLYLVGGSAHPGGGLPLVAMGAGIVAAMIDSDMARRR